MEQTVGDGGDDSGWTRTTTTRRRWSAPASYGGETRRPAPRDGAVAPAAALFGRGLRGCLQRHCVRLADGEPGWRQHLAVSAMTWC